MQIRLDIDHLHATQDTAVSIAFLVTEVVELGMLCGASLVSIVLEQTGPGTARLDIEADSLTGTPQCEAAVVDRFERIITGLARQLRSTLEREPGTGRHSVTITVQERD
jgi:hypothetical protein